MSIRTFWRLAPGAINSASSIFEAAKLTGPLELVVRLKPRHGVLLACWDAQAQVGRVSAFGIVTRGSNEAAEVDWREVDIPLRPNASGRIHWAKKPFFAFAKDVVARYMLQDLFAERFPDLEALDFAPAERLPALSPRLPTAAVGGYVYVIRSKYGFKIGKTVNLKSRTRLFEVKLPFPIALEHYAWFEDYSRAERDFHEMFHAKRKEGEWFDLEPEDLAAIKTFGKVVPVEGLH